MSHSGAKQDVNPARRPPGEMIQEAQQLAGRLGRPVYLYQSADGWGIARQLPQVPAGALITEIRGNPDDPELWNTGGC